MKRILFIIAIILFSFASQAQKGEPVVITAANVEGNETVYFEVDAFTKNYTLVIQALCTEVAGTSDGTITLQSSTDGVSWSGVVDEVGKVKGYPSDSLTITDGAIGKWVLHETPDYKYRLKVEGTASDTTLISPCYIRKDN